MYTGSADDMMLEEAEADVESGLAKIVTVCVIVSVDIVVDVVVSWLVIKYGVDV